MEALAVKVKKPLLRNVALIRRSASRLRTGLLRLSSMRIKYRAIVHKRRLASARSLFSSYEDVAFVFQTFNKAKYAGRILEPFTEKGCKNIIVFADGCVDSSALRWHKRLKGKNHIVIAANDLHEISNYRLSLDIAAAWGCSHVVLLQDDDVYDGKVFEWLDSALVAAALYKAAVVGGNGGADIDCSFAYRYGDRDLLTEKFVTELSDSGITYNSLGAYERMIVPSSMYSANGLMPHRFVASVSRAPQLVDLNLARQLNFFPKALEPYQYDDYFNCFQAWFNGFSVVLMPFPKLATNVGVGGMRLYNNVTLNSRPSHFVDNWNFILNQFGDDFPRIDKDVTNANSKLIDG